MKKNVFLDLDNTLISAEAVEEFPFTKKGINEKAVQFTILALKILFLLLKAFGFLIE